MDTIIGLASSGLFGGLLGGLFRLAPEVLKFFNGKSERVHELEMQRIQIERDKALHEQGLQKLQVESQIVLDKGGLDALLGAVQAQATPTGIKWVDALSSSFRPVASYWYLALYSGIKTVTLAVGIIVAWDNMGAVVATLQDAWTPNDAALFAGIMNFWFLDRVIRKNNGT